MWLPVLLSQGYEQVGVATCITVQRLICPKAEPGIVGLHGTKPLPDDVPPYYAKIGCRCMRQPDVVQYEKWHDVSTLAAKKILMWFCHHLLLWQKTWWYMIIVIDSEIVHLHDWWNSGFDGPGTDRWSWRGDWWHQDDCHHLSRSCPMGEYHANQIYPVFLTAMYRTRLWYCSNVFLIFYHLRRMKNFIICDTWQRRSRSVVTTFLS